MSDAVRDGLDRDIVRLLEHDGRVAFREIARELDVSEATIRTRYRRLTESGGLKVVAFALPDPGTSRLALLQIKARPETVDELAGWLSRRPEVSYVSTVIGPFEIFAQVLVADDAALWAFVQHELRRHPATLDVDLALEVAVHKLWFEHPA